MPIPRPGHYPVVSLFLSHPTGNNGKLPVPDTTSRPGPYLKMQEDNMRKTFLIFLAATMLLSFTAVVSAYQTENSLTCTTDSYGCWVSGQNSEKIYITVWPDAGNGEAAVTPAPDSLTVTASKAVVNKPDDAGVLLYDVPSGYGTVLRAILNGSTVTLTGEKRLTEGEWWVKVRNASGVEGWLPESVLAVSSGIEPGNTFTFGNWEQDNDTENGPEAIEWQVLAVEDGRIFVISRYGLDVKPYNNEGTGTDWETSSLRDWMNNEFCSSAFTAAEKARIIPVSAAAGTSGTDRIRQLDIDDVTAYFEGQDQQDCELTAYAENNGGSPDLVFWRPAEIADGNAVMVIARPAFWMNISDLKDSGQITAATPTADPVLTLTPIIIPPTPTPLPEEPVISAPPADQNPGSSCHVECWAPDDCETVCD